MDVLTNCKNGVTTQVSGKVVIRTNLVTGGVSTIKPKINRQMPSGVAETKYGNRYDDVGYYYK